MAPARSPSLRAVDPRQRLTFLAIAAVIAALAVVLLATGAGGGGGASTPSASRAPASSRAPEAPEASGREPEAARARRAGPLLTGGREQEIRATEGDTVSFRVRLNEDDEVHVHGYDLEREVPAGTTVRIALEATITGIFEIETHHSGVMLGRLRVDPR